MTFDVDCTPVPPAVNTPCSIYLFKSQDDFNSYVNGSRSQSLWLTPPTILGTTKQEIVQSFPCSFNGSLNPNTATGVFAIVNEIGTGGSITVLYNYEADPIVLPPPLPNVDLFFIIFFSIGAAIIALIAIIACTCLFLFLIHKRRRKAQKAPEDIGYNLIKSAEVSEQRLIELGIASENGEFGF